MCRKLSGRVSSSEEEFFPPALMSWHAELNSLVCVLAFGKKCNLDISLTLVGSQKSN